MISKKIRRMNDKNNKFAETAISGKYEIGPQLISLHQNEDVNVILRLLVATSKFLSFFPQ